jgi:tetratricopeptide (TPR) repeat protein
MRKDSSRTAYGTRFRRLTVIRASAAVFLVLVLAAVSVPLLMKMKGKAGGERKELLRLWEAGSFDRVFTLSKTVLASKPLDYFSLTIHGFSAYQMGISQINSLETQYYIDECIHSLRKAMLLKNAAEDGRVYYVLGKAYTYKGDSYAALAVAYLEQARELSYGEDDIPEYLGMARAAGGDYRGSVAAFSEALSPAGVDVENPSGLLLLSIARSYAALGEWDMARAYLVRCIDVSPDSRITVSARLLLADILRGMGDLGSAETQCAAVLSEAGENADAHYQLGEIYTLRGDATRARAKWRDALKVDPTHTKARIRLNS